MLPNLYYQCYQKLSELLKEIQQAAIAPDIVTPRLRQDILAAQQYFQQQIASLDSQEIDPAVESRVRSLSTEISKQLNLLNIDVTFLQAAKQPQTLRTRQQQINQRLQTLVGYCEAILGVGSRESGNRAGGAGGEITSRLSPITNNQQHSTNNQV